MSYLIDQSVACRAARVVEVDPQSDPRWERFIASHPEAVIYHHPGWLRALELEYGRKTLNLGCEDVNGDIRAILPLLTTRGVPFFRKGQVGQRLSSLPRTPVAGPLAKDSHALKMVLNAAVDLVRQHRGLRLQLKLANRDHQGLVEGLVFVPWRSSYVLALPPDPDNLHFGDSRNRHRIRCNLRTAEKFGIVLRSAESEVDLRAWYPLYLETMRWHAVPARSYRFFRSLWELLAPGRLMRLLLAESHRAGHTRIVAGSIFLSFGSTVFHSFTGAHRKDLSMRPNDLIIWHAIHEACNEGFSFLDFGEVAGCHEGLAQFKSKWGAKPKRLYRAFSPALPQQDAGDKQANFSHKLTVSAWRRVPLEATALVGDLIYRFL